MVDKIEEKENGILNNRRIFLEGDFEIKATWLKILNPVSGIQREESLDYWEVKRGGWKKEND